ncbi:MAG: hypothetical protein GY913_02285 [Proteobacteria bacterium]|nr:hypothetical protein [Pseudomonadota bacterium]MCP4915728.1 hypothetical protein [Pseudomonadota bacterium]
MVDTCPKCRKGTLHWDTRRLRDHPVDIYACGRCQHAVAEEDWTVPLHPPEAGCCRNCGGHRRSNTCTQCGLTAVEDAEVHQELRALIDPNLDLLSAALSAEEGGRKLLALKLATAACLDGSNRSPARLLRLSILQDLGELGAALSDCKHWIRGEGARSSVAWAVYGEMLLNNLRQGEATEAFRVALELDPEDQMTRASLSKHLYAMGRFAQARQGAESVLAAKPGGRAERLAVGVMARYAEHLMRQGDVVAVRNVLDALGEEMLDLNARLLALDAWLHWSEGHAEAAREALQQANRLDADDRLVNELKDVVGLKRSWWSWN